MLALIPSTASAQSSVVALPQRVAFTSLVSPDIVVARLMSFDRDQDGKVSTDELSERMRAVVARADRNGDGAVDAAEVRAVAAAPVGRTTGLGGIYTFGDVVGVPVRTQIANAIEDMRLPAVLSEQASEIGAAYAREVEDEALVRLREAVGPMLTDAQLAEFEASVKVPSATGGFCLCQSSETAAPMASSMVIRMSTQSSSLAREVVMVAALPMLQLSRYDLSAGQKKTAMAALAAFNAERQLDDARRSALMTRLEGLLSDGEREDLQAALARRPLVKNTPVKEAAVSRGRGF
jgi:hypothetical protein